MRYVLPNRPATYIVLLPGVAISLAVIALNLLGHAIRAITDPACRGGLG